MRGVAKARANRDQSVWAIQVLEQLSCHIDDEAEESIRSTGKWYLAGNRADWISSQGVQRLQGRGHGDSRTQTVDLRHREFIQHVNAWKPVNQ